MRFVNEDNIYFKICFKVFRDVSSRVSVAAALMNTPRAASPLPDLLEFSAGSDVSIVVKHEI